MSKFQPGVSGNPKGRPPRKRQVSALLEEALEKKLPDVLAKVIESALAGDMTAAKMLLDRAIPPLKAVEPTIRLPMHGGELDGATDCLYAIGEGEIPPDQGARIMGALVDLARIREVTSMEQRLSALEAVYQGHRPPPH